ncbi:MAG: DUF2309 domain-containing protein [Thalassobaculaceae bacterium]
MNAQTGLATAEPLEAGSLSTEGSAMERLAPVEQALRRVAPLWPLDRFVAVNPFLGLDDHRFGDAVGRIGQVSGARMLMERSFFADAIRSGRVEDRDLAEALAAAGAQAGLPGSVTAIKAALFEHPQDGAPAAPIKTVADIATALTGTDWSRIAVQQISQSAASHFQREAGADAGESFYRAWRAVAVADRTPEILGLTGARAHAEHLPEDARETIEQGLALLGIDPAGTELYCHRLLMTVSGWAGYARHLLWEAELHGGSDDGLLELLAARIGWEVILRGILFDDIDMSALWATERIRYRSEAGRSEGRPLDELLLDAYERAWQRRFATGLVDRAAGAVPVLPTLQAAFCIDVRSEVFRRALESVSEEVETIGFAGFFGLPLKHVPLGREDGLGHCPVLLAPSMVASDTAGTGPEARSLAEARQARRGLFGTWTGLKRASVSSFPFVEVSGLGYAVKLATDALGLSRPVPSPKTAGLSEEERTRLDPELALRPANDAGAEIDLGQRIDMASAILNGMSLTRRFAPVVLLVGHGSSTVNNLHASGLDCGACGGQSGEVSARVAASILNDPEVRTGLADGGIVIPDDTVFVGALHDTTTDEVTLFDRGLAVRGQGELLATCRAWLSDAGRIARLERAPTLNGADGPDPHSAVHARARDWSQVRPEWGLAGCAAFVAAPRARTAGLDLDGRVFLHSYDWKADPEFAVLDLIMTAPMVVASWINLQYYGSSVDNAVFGSGNKTLHNAVGSIGVLEGNGGDLRTGLPLQSVHDGERLVHEPMRLSVFIEAPQAAIDAVIERHEAVGRLVRNGWIALFSLDEDGRAERRCTAPDRWEPMAS